MPASSSLFLPSSLLALALALAGLAGLWNAGCSRHSIFAEEDAGEDAGVEGEDAGVVLGVDASRADASDAAAAHDARTDLERANLADAGRLCGEHEQPDCPLQGWMKRNATTMITFGETTTLAEVFDEIGMLAPPTALVGRRYPYWASISRDGAAASRLGNIPAARAACRGCHSQYSGSYHGELRGLALPPLPPLGQPR